MLIKSKNNKAKCPDCGKLITLCHDDEKDVMFLECCKTWSLFPKETELEKPKKARRSKPKKTKVVKKPKKVSAKNKNLLNNLIKHHKGAIDGKEKEK